MHTHAHTVYVYIHMYMHAYTVYVYPFISTHMHILYIYTAAAAAAAKLFQSCPILYNPIDGSPPGSPSLGFSRQEHWSGLPFPFPMQESEKCK